MYYSEIQRTGKQRFTVTSSQRILGMETETWYRNGRENLMPCFFHNIISEIQHIPDTTCIFMILHTGITSIVGNFLFSFLD